MFPQVSPRLVALHLHVYKYVFFRCCICQTAYNSWIVWPGVPPFKFPPARPLVQGAVADKGDEARWCAKCGPRCPLIQLPVVWVLAQVPEMFALELCMERLHTALVAKPMFMLSLSLDLPFPPNTPTGLLLFCVIVMGRYKLAASQHRGESEG